MRARKIGLVSWGELRNLKSASPSSILYLSESITMRPRNAQTLLFLARTVAGAVSSSYAVLGVTPNYRDFYMTFDTPNGYVRLACDRWPYVYALQPDDPDDPDDCGWSAFTTPVRISRMPLLLSERLNEGD